jgi:parallel beta-helix repeat protein
MTRNFFTLWARLLVVASVLLPASLGAQTLVVTPTTVTATTAAGSSPASQTVRVSNGAKGALKWTVVQSNSGWVSVSPGTGVNSGTLTVTFSTAALTVAGSPYQTTFRVDAKGTPSVTVTVRVTVTAAPPPPTLTVTCPANITVASPDGNAVAVNYNTATTSGGVPPVTVSGVPASGSSFSVGTTSVLVTAKSSDSQTVTCSFSVTVTYTAPPPGQLTVTCPANISAASPDGSPVPVSYTVSTSGGVAPITVVGSPASGSNFAVGSIPVQVNASSNDGQTASCSFYVIVSYTPPSSSSVGPQSSIGCPVGAIDIFPGKNNIQAAIDAYLAGTAFCLRAGTFSVTMPITPKTGDVFVGQFGAILDGTGWDQTDTDTTHCAFRAYQQDIDNVTIRNLVIRNMRQCAIMAFYQNSDHWTIDYNEIASNNAGIIFPGNSLIRNNFIHNNYNLGYQADVANNSTLENNEISYNGYEQKIIQSANVTFRGNFIHHNEGPGIWYDSDNTGALIENNRIEDNHTMGIFYEVSGTATIRNNTIKRSGDTGIFISTSRDSEIYMNTLEDNFRGITYLANCPSVGGGTIFFDLLNDSTHDNTIRLTAAAPSFPFTGAFATVNCSATQIQKYQSAAQKLTFTNNSYYVPSPTTVKYWFYFDVMKLFSEWQALGLDITGTVQ